MKTTTNEGETTMMIEGWISHEQVIRDCEDLFIRHEVMMIEVDGRMYTYQDGHEIHREHPMLMVWWNDLSRWDYASSYSVAMTVEAHKENDRRSVYFDAIDLATI
jgi:hypothetical protein